jgi:hypothetical protein
MDGSPDAVDALNVESFDVEWFSEGEEVRHRYAAVDVGFEDVAPSG